MVKIGIVGTGYEIGIANQHIQGYKLQPDAEITAVYDSQPGRAAEYIARHALAGATACESYAQLLELVDAVSICTPNDSHVALAGEAIDAGKHVLCEKPFAPTAGECEALVQKARQSGLVCMIGLCYRGIPAYRMLKRIVDTGELGEIFYTRQSMGGGRIANPAVQLEWRMQQPKSGPGAMADFGSHMLDLNNWILAGSCGPLAEMACMANTFIETRARQDTGAPGKVTNDDVAVFNAKTTGGVLCSFSASRVGATHTFEIFGSKGSAAFTGDSFAIEVTTGGKPQTLPAGEDCYLGAPEAARVPFLINFYQETREFLNLIQNGGETEIDFARGLYVQQLIDAVQAAALAQKTVPVQAGEGAV